MKLKFSVRESKVGMFRSLGCHRIDGDEMWLGGAVRQPWSNLNAGKDTDRQASSECLRDRQTRWCVAFVRRPVFLDRTVAVGLRHAVHRRTSSRIRDPELISRCTFSEEEWRWRRNMNMNHKEHRLTPQRTGWY
jgi:hypothetical protein